MDTDCKSAVALGKLWTAPELIDPANPPSVQAYQKGDVYSFAIICQEVVYRMGVFNVEEEENITPEGRETDQSVNQSINQSMN